MPETMEEARDRAEAVFADLVSSRGHAILDAYHRPRSSVYFDYNPYPWYKRYGWGVIFYPALWYALTFAALTGSMMLGGAEWGNIGEGVAGMAVVGAVFGFIFAGYASYKAQRYKLERVVRGDKQIVKMVRFYKHHHRATGTVRTNEKEMSLDDMLETYPGLGVVEFLKPLDNLVKKKQKEHYARTSKEDAAKQKKMLAYYQVLEFERLKLESAKEVVERSIAYKEASKAAQ